MLLGACWKLGMTPHVRLLLHFRLLLHVQLLLHAQCAQLLLMSCHSLKGGGLGGLLLLLNAWKPCVSPLTRSPPLGGRTAVRR